MTAMFCLVVLLCETDKLNHIMVKQRLLAVTVIAKALHLRCLRRLGWVNSILKANCSKKNIGKWKGRRKKENSKSWKVILEKSVLIFLLLMREKVISKKSDL